METLPFFVYGTLRSGQANYHLLRGKTVTEEPASIDNAALYALPEFPMLMKGTGIVCGEVITLKPTLYAQLVQQLDDFEGSTPDDNYLYRRVKQSVWLESGTQITAWVYIGNLQYMMTVPHTHVPHGDWSRYVRECTNAQS